MATIKDVAKRANVSTTTVSHVINKTRFVAEETRNAVWAAIKELHYSPSAVARSLKVNHTKSIGLLATSSEAAYFAEIIEAVEKNCFQKGYTLILGNAWNNLEKQRAYLSMMAQKRVDGLLVMCSEYPEPLLAMLEEYRHIPMVVMDWGEAKADFTDAVIDNAFEGGYMAGRYLIERGHREIGVIPGPLERNTGAGRLAGFMKAMEEAMIKVIAGPEKRSRVVSQYERKLTAFHEAGHAIAMYCLPTQDPVHMITIVPRGMAGGMTISLPQDDQSFVSKSEMFETIVGFLGGRVAEQLKLDDISTGASNDIQRATAIARDMVSKYAMSDKLGPVCYSSGNEVFIGRDYEKTKSYSEAVAGRIDDEVQSILTAAYQKCTDILKSHDDKLEAVASYLMAHNNMGRPQFEAVMEGKPIPDADVLPIESIEPVDEPDTQPEENA